MVFNAILFTSLVAIYFCNAQTVLQPSSCKVVINQAGNPLTYIEFSRTNGQSNVGIEYYLYYTDTSATSRSRYLTQPYSADSSSYYDYQMSNWVNLDIDIDTAYDVYMRGYHSTSDTFSNNVAYCTVTARPTAAPTPDTPSPTASPIGLNCNYGGNGWISSLAFPGQSNDWVLTVPYFGYSSVIISTCLSETDIATTLKLYDSSKSNLILSDSDGTNAKCASNQATSEIIFGESNGWWTQGYNYIVEIGGYLGAYGPYGINVTCNPWTPSPTPATGSIGCSTGSVTGSIDSAYEKSDFIFAMPMDLKSVAFSTCSSVTDVDTQLTLYNSTEQTKYIAFNGDPDPSVYSCTQGLGSGSRTSYLVFDHAHYANQWNPGKNYRLSVQDGYGLIGNFELFIICEYFTAAPSSAPTATPQVITCDSGTVSGYMTLGTRVQYIFDVPVNAKSIQFSTCNTGTTIDTHLYLWRTSSKSSLIEQNDDYDPNSYTCDILDGLLSPDRASVINFDESMTGVFVPGATGYLLEVGGFEDDKIGDYQLTATCAFDPTTEPTPAPTQPPSEAHVSIDCGAKVSGAIVKDGQVKYYMWSPPTSLKSVIFTTCDIGTTVDTILSVYEGLNPSASFQALRQDDDYHDNEIISEFCESETETTHSEIVLDTSEYAIYQYNYYTIKIGGFGGTAQGDYTLNVICEYYTDNPSNAPSKAPITSPPTLAPSASPITVTYTDAPTLAETQSVPETTAEAAGCESHYVQSFLWVVLWHIVYLFME